MNASLPALEQCSHETAMAFLVDRYQAWRKYECPYCEIQRLSKENGQLRLDLAQHKGNASEVIRLQELLSAAITLLAEWTLCVELNGSSWDDWDECYKEASGRPGPLRALLDAERERLRKTPMWEGKS